MSLQLQEVAEAGAPGRRTFVSQSLEATCTCGINGSYAMLGTAADWICTLRTTGSSSKSAGGRFLESKSFPEDGEFVLNPMCREEPKRQLMGHARKESVAEDDLSGSEAGALHEVLTQVETGMAVEEEDMPVEEEDMPVEEEDMPVEEEDMPGRRKTCPWRRKTCPWRRKTCPEGKRFMTEFPQVRQELEECIRKLREFADQADKVNKHCTISKIVASSTGVVSGILTIVGLSLAPVTAGASLVLLATGVGLGTAATVTGVSASIVENSNSSKVKAKASHLLSTGINKKEMVQEALRHGTPQVAYVTGKCIKSVKDVVENAKAIRMAQANLLLLSDAKSVMTTGTVSVRSSNQIQKAFGGTVLAMSKGARIAGLAFAGVTLLVDTISLVKESKYLHEGAKMASAEELRQKAQTLEKKLEFLTMIHEHLQRA
ncbi:apolipoprotein L3 isoform X2 [Pteropus medius]|uniref:apolipoprotein L3 isoform X2 n=1 Tax=Pteropus vampyrus TaxID=132908 RepID=UPI00196B9767|nr:apolipoprotein L3 isoform X2 [Pteropus giganteus]